MPIVSRPFGDIIAFTRASSATRFNAAGVLETVSSDTPRIDYDPVTLAPKGLLIEEQRTNLVLQSEDFSTTWSNINSVKQTNVAISPAGTQTADLLQADGVTTTSPREFRQNVNGTVNIAHTFSVYAKAAAGSFLGFAFRNQASAANFCSAEFNLSTGSISVAAINGGTATGATASITSVGNGWYRCSVSGVADTSGTQFTVILTGRTTTDNNNVAANTELCYLWGAQLEAGAFDTSYIPTTTAAATRAADLASVNTLSPWYNQNEGTLFVEFLRPSAPTSTHIAAQIQSTGTNRHALLFTTAGPGHLRGLTAVANVTQADIFTGVFTSITAPSKLAYAYQVNNFAAAANGTLGAVDTSGTVPIQLDQMWIGQNSVGNCLSGYLRRITYYPRRLSNSELQEITA